MATQSFPLREPTEYDRLFGRLTTYIDVRLDAVNNQMRVGFAESAERDEALSKRIENIEGEVRNIEGEIRNIEGEVRNIRGEVSTVVAFQQTLMETFKSFALDISKQVADGFAAQAERHNELMMRVDKIEKQLNPPKE